MAANSTLAAIQFAMSRDSGVVAQCIEVFGFPSPYLTSKNRVSYI
jgi:hypothetical protein